MVDATMGRVGDGAEVDVEEVGDERVERSEVVGSATLLLEGIMDVDVDVLMLELELGELDGGVAAASVDTLREGVNRVSDSVGGGGTAVVKGAVFEGGGVDSEL